MDLNQLIIGISDYVGKLLRDNLKPDFHFHNLSHTENVVAGAREIGLASGLDHDELVTLMIGIKRNSWGEIIFKHKFLIV